MMVFFLSSLISSLVKMRLREMMTPAVPEKKEEFQADLPVCKHKNNQRVLQYTGHHYLL